MTDEEGREERTMAMTVRKKVASEWRQREEMASAKVVMECA